MAIGIYTISLFFHILAVAGWLATIPIDAVQRRVLLFVVEEAATIKSLGIIQVNAKISVISGIVILLSGAAMTGSNWFKFDGFAWLAVKQIIFIGLFVAGGTIMRGLDEQLGGQIEKKEIDEAKTTIGKMRRISHIFTLFIIINIFLATTKPF